MISRQHMVTSTQESIISKGSDSLNSVTRWVLREIPLKLRIFIHICNIIKTIFFNFGKVLFPHGNCIWSCCIYNHSISNWLAAWRRRSNITLPNQFPPNIKHVIFIFQHIWFFLTQTPWYCALKTVAHMKACFRRLTHDWKTTFHLARWLHFSTLLVVAHAFYRWKNSVASLDNL